MQILAGQGVGVVSGEWRGVHGKPITQMFIAIVVLILACIMMAYASSLSRLLM